MYDLILSSNSSFSKSFKNDIANILIQLRENGQLSITKDKISLKKIDVPKNNLFIGNEKYFKKYH